jgi:membrane protein YdbS with pleckstrin-like domain
VLRPALMRRRPIRYLASGEAVELEARKHWTALADPFFQAVAVILGALLLGSILSPNEGSDFFDDFLSVVTVFFIGRFVFYVFLWQRNRIVITNQRVIEDYGIFTRNRDSMPLVKVTDLRYHQSMMGIILNYGELVLESAGQQQAIGSIDHLANPEDFYRTFLTLLARVHGGAPPPPGPAPQVEQVVADGDDWDEGDDGDTGPIPRVIV